MLKPRLQKVLWMRSAILLSAALILLSGISAFAQRRLPASPARINTALVNKSIHVEIVRAEDERRWDSNIQRLLSHRNPAVRSRAALAAGRIGDEKAVSGLLALLQNDQLMEVRSAAAFALGEIESPQAADALISAQKDSAPLTRARAIEALGKIAAALPKEQEARAREIGSVILDELGLEARRRGAPNRLTVLLGLTAVLRAKSPNAGPIVAGFLTHPDPRVRADAGNTLARLKLNDGNSKLRQVLGSDPDPIVRANAARVLGGTEDKEAFERLLNSSLKDRDARVRVSAIRALASLKDARATSALLYRGLALLAQAKKTSDNGALPLQVGELLEIATTLGRVRQNSNDERTLKWLRELRPSIGPGAPEVEIAQARVHPEGYLNDFGSGPQARRNAQEAILLDWRRASSLAQGLGELASLPDTTRENKVRRSQAQDLLRAMLDYRDSDIIVNTLVRVHSEYAIPDVLRAYAAFKTSDLAKVLHRHLKDSDPIVRATAAELLGELPLDTNNIASLSEALKVALQDRDMNDAALAIIDALAKQKNRNANLAIMPSLDSSDHLIRRKAVIALKATGAGDFSARVASVKTLNTTADYERALSRINTPVSAVVSTTKGSFTIRFLPEEAPLTVDNFIRLAKRGYFNGIVVHRVVPNFVIQDGDPRGDGNGGPGYQIRCEINEAPYERGAVGMALSGKDTGGSQWFVTHSPQPHLDGGYTVFGNVVEGMNVVDAIVRGDVIRSIEIRERTPSTVGRSR
jgi:cyclophilin family peptidyl-prolyl cis-trans isomerase/HEAT repeat protein